jgi:hypothetical protein
MDYRSKNPESNYPRRGMRRDVTVRRTRESRGARTRRKATVSRHVLGNAKAVDEVFSVGSDYPVAEC